MAISKSMLTVHEERCLNRRHRSEFCHICCDTCPQNAIDIHDLSIRIDAAKCDLCALCIADCPTEAFTHEDFSPLDFLTQVSGNKTLDLRCKFMDNRESERGHVRIPCHGLLDERLLTGLHAVAVEHVYLHGVSQCEACPSRVGNNRLSETLERASPELQKRFPFIHTNCDNVSDSPLTEIKRNLHDAETPMRAIAELVERDEFRRMITYGVRGTAMTPKQYTLDPLEIDAVIDQKPELQAGYGQWQETFPRCLLHLPWL